MKMIRNRFALAISLVLGVTSLGRSDEFPQFRGVNGQGVVRNQQIPIEWSKDQNLAWKIAVPGSGWSQPVIWNDLLFVTSAAGDKELRPKDFGEGVKMPQSMGLGGLSAAPKVTIDWQVICYNAKSGELLWSQSVSKGKPEFPVHPSNTYATESPVADANGIYAFFGATGTAAGFNHRGELLWKKELGAYPTSNGFGTGSSLAIHNGKIIIQHYTEKSSNLVCLNAATGEDVWQRNRDAKGTSWSSPIVWKNDMRSEVISSGGDLVQSFDPDSGELLWSMNNVKAATACSVASDGQRLYFGGSDPMSKGPLFAIKAGGAGDVSPKKKNGKSDVCDWLAERAGPGMASPLSSGKFVFVTDNNILRCYDASTGSKLVEKRLGQLKLVAASPLLIDDRLLIVDEEGNGILVTADAGCEQVGAGKIEDTFWATPAVANNSIYLRGIDALYCIRTTNP